MTKPARLITIPFSHYCERARWAADWVQFAYVEDAYIPGRHLAPMRRAGGKTVPVLVTSVGTFADSTAIVAFLDSVAPADRKLYPADPGACAEVMAFEKVCSEELGVATRLNAYHYGLGNVPALLRRVAPSLTATQRIAMRVVMPFVGPLIRRKYRVTEANATSARALASRVFEMAGKRLEAMPFLNGEHFGAADITFASLAALAVSPPGHPSFDVDAPAASPAARALVEECRATRAGEHVLELYRTYRHVGSRAART